MCKQQNNHIQKLVLLMASIVSSNASCERYFSILENDQFENDDELENNQFENNEGENQISNSQNFDSFFNITDIELRRVLEVEVTVEISLSTEYTDSGEQDFNIESIINKSLERRESDFHNLDPLSFISFTKIKDVATATNMGSTKTSVSSKALIPSKHHVTQKTTRRFHQ
ncbi:hypothetical protein Glove_86g228 [Diversispora epigaea]|uniref:HAT C-terminal dimerisation domain-containing protein n=1 Tax=Diversispora epigaea TaxID=1348612 RepID=A0A397JDB6_9GLOM|nr:hypothetical protein Glove_86g228 [Diversispora epigaea]